jgi:hypothetical protein
LNTFHGTRPPYGPYVSAPAGPLAAGQYWRLHWTIGDDPLAVRKPTLSGFPPDFPATPDEKATADVFEKALLQHLCPALGPDTPISISSIADRALGHTRAPLTAVLVRATLADDQGLPGPPFLIVLALPTTAIDRIPVPFSLRPGRNP